MGTAVPGLAAKPIIDVLVGIDAEDTGEAVQRIVELGYEDRGSANVEGRGYLCRREPAAFNVQLCARDSAHVYDNLVLRDYLRAHPADSAEYGALKRRLVVSGHDRLLAYSGAKSFATSRLGERAREWDRRRRDDSA